MPPKTRSQDSNVVKEGVEESVLQELSVREALRDLAASIKLISATIDSFERRMTIFEGRLQVIEGHADNRNTIVSKFPDLDEPNTVNADSIAVPSRIDKSTVDTEDYSDSLETPPCDQPTAVATISNHTPGGASISTDLNSSDLVSQSDPSWEAETADAVVPRIVSSVKRPVCHRYYLRHAQKHESA
ncbi:hypothetical protein SEPCBS119000_005957 [Sporothrix epigloea]|uniref:Uncharacterized protein n=1 Tax=Sporothrix epigloea TaxID=1892477 RepID=A0ABP0E0N4_9PEZI